MAQAVAIFWFSFIAVGLGLPLLTFGAARLWSPWPARLLLCLPLVPAFFLAKEAWRLKLQYDDHPPKCGSETVATEAFSVFVAIWALLIIMGYVVGRWTRRKPGAAQP